MMPALRRLMLGVIAALALTGPVLAQGDSQLEVRLPVAVIPGGFDNDAEVSPETRPDEFAALEQQRWREFRFDVLHAVVLDFSVRSFPLGTNSGKFYDRRLPLDLVRMIALVSLDGENYTPLLPGEMLQPGMSVSVLVAQLTLETADGLTRFIPSQWTLTVDAVWPVGGTAPYEWPVVEISAGNTSLGCIELGCGNAVGADLSAGFTGGPDPDSGGSPGSGAPEPARRDDLAAELQRELARVGCSAGTVDGLWGPASRRAMADYNRQAGSDLPVETATARALVAVARATAPVCSR